MTAQVGDRFTYKKEGYNIVALSEPLKFNPKDYGITPTARCTGCWAGFWCEYDISETGIVLKNFFINSKDDHYPEVNGVLPECVGHSKTPREYMGHHCYRGVNISIPYTGKIVVGKDFLQEYYIHMGYQRAWAYEVLKEFVFEDGKLVETIDHSEVAEGLRKQIKEDPDFWEKLHSNIPLFVGGSFDLSLATKAWWIKQMQIWIEDSGMEKLAWEKYI